MPPRLGVKGTLSFYEKAKVPDKLKKWAKDLTGMEAIIKILHEKFEKTGRENRMYLLEGRTASGKSTFMMSSLFNEFIPGSRAQIICSEPMIVLTISNAMDVLNYFPKWSLGVEMGIHSSQMNVVPAQESILYCTTQILANTVLSILKETDPGEAKKKLKRIKFIIIDEVHKVDLPMMSTLSLVLDLVNKFGDLPECPMVVFASATLDAIRLSEYFEIDLLDAYNYGLIYGVGNFPTKELFLKDEEVAKMNEQEKYGKSRTVSFEVIGKYFYDHFYNDLWNSTSTIERGGKKIQCRDALIFTPIVAGIDAIGLTLVNLIKDVPTFLVKKDVRFKELQKWRNANKGKKRVSIIGYATGFAQASDEILSGPIENDNDVIENETKIFISTGAIEVGKTIYTLYLGIDLGLHTKPAYIPLSYVDRNKMQYFRQLPSDVGGITQRLGRVGRVAPGVFLHFYSENTFKRVDKAEKPETVATYLLSNMFLNNISTKQYQHVDVANENHYLYPTSLDIITRTAQDLIQAGCMDIYGHSVFLGNNADNFDDVYSNYLYEICNVPFVLAYLHVQINRKDIPLYLNPSEFMTNVNLGFFKNIFNNPKPTLEDLDMIRKARNKITTVMYSEAAPTAYYKDRMFNGRFIDEPEQENNRPTNPSQTNPSQPNNRPTNPSQPNNKPNNPSQTNNIRNFDI